ncbi:unnamed protein product [Brachionus calyciflorus]|uniref:ABC transporter domain-containing protein n=1 Tax=Brachionus calyciflorus TaxID=104777 RepID=A0A814D0U2_9BILA|nr:unnamed protein product [Brachionus calyciflorus]
MKFKNFFNRFPIHGLTSTFKQFIILSWKNLLIIKRKPLETLFEILMSLFFISLILVLRNYVEILFYQSTSNSAYSVIDFFYKTASQDLVLFYPNTPIIKNIVNRAFRIIKSQKYWLSLSIQGTNESEAIDLDFYSANRLLAYISFPADYGSYLPDNVVYTITTREQTDFIYNVGQYFYAKKEYMFSKSPEQLCHDNKYFRLYNSFNSIKHAIDLSLIQEMTSIPMNDAKKIKIQQLGCPSYYSDELKSSFGFLIPLIIQIAFMFTLINNIGHIVREKHTKMTEYLKIVGIKGHVYWFSCFLRSFIIYIILSLLVSYFCFFEISPKRDDPRLATKVLLKHTSFSVVIISMIIYSLHTSIFTLFMSQFFIKPLIAKIVVLLMWLITSVNFYNDLNTMWIKYLICVFPNVGLTFIFQIIFQFERSEKRKDLSNLFSSLFDDGFNLGLVFISMLSWSLFLIPLMWYLNKILPSKFGIPMPFYFLFMPNYWLSKIKYKRMVETYSKNIQVSNNFFEKDPNNLKLTVNLQNISKEFRNGLKKKKAVNNLSIKFFENQIISLLGHNGAGKTTSIFMLCGIYPPSSGQAIIFDHNLRTSLSKIRKIIGFCPQSSILYDDLTVYEHFYLIAAIKGHSKEDLENEIQKTASSLNLNEQLTKKSKNLSGGMKRRLNIGMALIGGSKIVILDEPSSGVDPKNRRQLWNILQKLKLNRTIIISTHYMQEADFLSDRIAILNQGEVKCCGSPKFLKSNFCKGYKLNIKKSSDFNEIVFKNIIEVFDENYEIETNNLNEICVYLRTNSTENIRSFLENIENNKFYIGFDSYSISSPTIEEVFLKMGKLKNEKLKNGFKTSEKNRMLIENQDLAKVFSYEINKSTGRELFSQQLKALLIKRFRILIHRYFLAIIMFLFPIIIQTLSTILIPSKTNLVNKYDENLRYAGRLKLNVENYGDFRIVYHIANSSYSDIPLRSMLNKFYSNQNRPNIQLMETKHENISKFLHNEQKTNLKYLINDFYMALSLNITNSEKFQAILYYSTLAFHSSATALNEISNLILTFLTNDITKSITTFNAPLLSNNSLYNGNDLFEFLGCLDILPVSVLNIIISLLVSYMISINVISVARERISGSKQLQLLSGTNFLTYWLSNYLFDLILFGLINTCILVCLKLVDVIRGDVLNESNALVSDSNFFYLSLLLFFSAFSCCTLSYIWSFFFKSEIIGFITMFIILGVGIFLDTLFTFLQLFISMDPFDKSKIFFNFLGTVKSIFLFMLPSVTVLSTSYSLDEGGLSFSQPGIASLLIIFMVQFLIGNIILMLLENKNKINFREMFRKKIKDEKNDDKVEKNENSNQPLVVENLSKKYGRKKNYILQDLGLVVKKSECFGILGLNGAGKTTLLKIIIGELRPTIGSVKINNFNIHENLRNSPKNLGYCPQFSYLPEFLKVIECFELFADIKGLDSKFKQFLHMDLVRIFQLDIYRDVQVKNLSEGNRRKLSTALAFMGNPELVILDEPTTGMDPASRVYFWNLIKKSQNFGITTVISSHSLEECEKLCSTLSIIRKGKIECTGSYNDIKNIYGHGFNLTIKCEHQTEPSNDIDVLEEYLLRKIPESIIQEKQVESLLVKIPKTRNSKYSISKLFSFVEKVKLKYKIESFNISETTLEQIFLSISELENENQDEYI